MEKRKKILITGAAEGIGLEILKLFIENNWLVTAHYYYKTKEFDAICKKNVESIDPKKIDFSNEEELNIFLKSLKNQTYDALVNCAGIFDFSMESKNRIESIFKTLMVNTISPILITEELFKTMKKNQSGSIVNISSVGVKFGSGSDSIFYGVSKSGLEASTRTFAREGAKYNILVNTVRPGITNTDFYKKIGKDLTERVKLIPLNRAAKASEIAEHVYFLIAVNTFMTGEIISVAGGEWTKTLSQSLIQI